MRDVSRRGVLVGAGAVAVMLATGSTARALGPKPLMRPPTIESDEDFLARCIRCQRCVNVCHARVIQPTSLLEGFATTGTPSMVFLHDYCDFCETENGGVPRCAEVCPTSALKADVEKPFVSALPSIVEHNCIAYNQDACRVCVDVCPRAAIGQDDKGRPVIDVSSCDGCGLCELKCPSVAIGNSSNLVGNGKGVVLRPRSEVSSEEGGVR